MVALLAAVALTMTVGSGSDVSLARTMPMMLVGGTLIQTKTAVGGPQFPAASWLSTKMRCRPAVNPVVLISACTASIELLNDPSLAAIGYEITLVAHEGASIE